MSAPPDPVGMERLLQVYFASRGFCEHQFSSFEEFMENGLTQIISRQEPIQVTNGSSRVIFRFGRVTITHPHIQECNGELRPILPAECVERRLTYACGIMADVVQDNYIRDHAGDNDDCFTPVSRFEFAEVPISTMPCPVRSKYCWLSNTAPDELHDSLGGYYIINGQEKVIQSQIKLRPNMIHVLRALKSTQGTATDETGQRLSNFTFEAEVRSVNESKYKATSSVKVTASCKSDGRITLIVSVPFMKCDVPLPLLLRILEDRFWTSDKEPNHESLLHRTVSHLLDAHPNPAIRRAFDAGLKSALEDNMADTSASDVLQFIANQGTHGRTPEDRYRSTLRLLRCDVLPHLGMVDDVHVWRSKWVYIMLLAGKALYAHVLSRITTAGGIRIGDDRDHWINKRTEPSGLLIGVLFRQNFAQYIKGLKADVHRRLEGMDIRDFHVIDCMAHSKLETSIRYHFSTGKWTVMRGVSPSSCTGVCAPMNRMTPVTALSCLNRVNVPVNREGKSTEPRQVHTSDWGNVCVVETPEGQGCGLVLNLCMLTHVRVGIDTRVLSAAVQDLLQDWGDENYTHVDSDTFLPDWMEGSVLVFVNGSILACVRNEQQCVAFLRTCRRAGDLSAFCSIVHYGGVSIHVNADPGVCMRPVIPVDKLGAVSRVCGWLASLPDGSAPVVATGVWQRLMLQGAIEYIDTEEQDAHWVVATSAEEALSNPGSYSHCEVNVNLAILGVCANTVPFSNHNQSPRIVYQSAMGKQAIGARTPGHSRRYDSNLFVLHYPQAPLSTTQFDRMVGTNEYPSSTEAVVLVAPFGGYNQEDSIILNRASADRGFAHCTTYRTYFDEVSGRGNDDERFSQPDAAAFDKRMADYSVLDQDGVGRVGASVKKGDVIICKTSQNLELAPDGSYYPVRRDRSTISKDDGVIDKVEVTTNREGNPLVRVRIRTMRQAMIGDKFAAKHAQKGTVGLVVPPEDLPYSAETGMVPDVIINPHGFVSRMTMGMFYELFAGKACSLSGTKADATAFRDRTEDVKDWHSTLLASGFEPTGKERFIDGKSGEMIEAPLYMGVCSYQTLRHLAAEKLNSRARGPRNIMTNQPMDGKSRGGGLRVGEMEDQTLQAHGAPAVRQDRMMLQSDAQTVEVCTRCGLFAEPAHNAQFSQGLRGREAFCRGCRTSTCAPKTIPAAFRLLVQELQCFHVGVRLH